MASMSRVHNLASRLAEHLPQEADPDSSETFVLSVLQAVPIAMEMAAELTDLSGEERKDLVVRAILYAMGRLDEEHYGGREEKQSALVIAQALVPTTGDMLYAAYRRRHTFRRTWGRRWHKLRACCLA